MNNTQNLKESVEIAEFKLALISPVLHGLFSDTSQTAYFKRITKDMITLPDGTSKRYSYKTPEKWLSEYRIGGFDALMPTKRSDFGKTRVLSDEAIAEIFRIKEAFPRLNATQIHDRLVEESYIPKSVNVCAVQRFIKRNDLKGARNLTMIDRKAFEEDAFGKMWQADTCYLAHIVEGGQSRQVYVMLIIDDHSRLLVGGGLFYSDNAYNFQKVLKSAIATYGIPDKVYVDNGAPYANEQLSLICGTIGTTLIHTRVRDGASKAKIERQFRSLKERWLYGLDISSIKSLEQFNSMLAEYIREYNVSDHSGIKEPPLERWRRTHERVRKPKSREWLDDSFFNRITRKVRRDSTIAIDNIEYDVPMQFIGMQVDVRYLPDNMDTAFILYENEHFNIMKTDKNANARTKRNNAPAIDYSKAGVL